jgi:putative N6-adenine-specific DNA methylase
VVETLFGFEEILAKELQMLGTRRGTGSKTLEWGDDKGFMYKANLSCIA